MHLTKDPQPLHVLRSMPIRTESAAARLLRSGELGAHLLHLAESAAAEHVAQRAQEAPDAVAPDRDRWQVSGRGDRPENGRGEAKS